MHRDTIQHTPRSARCHNERNERQLDSPVHRRTPQHPPPTIVPLHLPTNNQPVPAFQGDDPFALPPRPPAPSPTAARQQLDNLRAQAAAAQALLLPVQRRRGRQQQRVIVQNPAPVQVPPPTPQRLFLHQVLSFL